VKRRSVRIITLSIVVFFSALVTFMEFDYFWDGIDKIEEKVGYQNTKAIYNLHNNLDIVKALNFEELSEKDVVNISVKKSTLSKLMDQVSLFKVLGYQDDDQKKWFKAMMKVGNKPYESKIKLHGTSSTWLKRGLLSFKIKHKKNQEYPFGYRKFNLINVQDKYMSFSSAANDIASTMGLIAPSGRIILLYINGIKMGLYYLVEDHKKEFLERNYGVVDYATLSPRDKWTGTSRGHISPHDMNSYYYEVSGAKDISSADFARSQLELLFSSIKNNNHEAVLSLIDRTYIAKFLAFIYLFNDVHFITGDNLRLVYDFHRGKFYPIFRIENLPPKIENTNILEFNKSLFGTYDYSPTHEIFKYMVQNNKIRAMRDENLWELLSKKSKIMDQLSKNLNDNRAVLISSSFPRKRYEFLIRKMIKNIDNNFNQVERYLTYSALYIVNGDTSFYIADSMIPIKDTELNLVINNRLDNSLLPVFTENYVSTAVDQCQTIKKNRFINNITKHDIAFENIICVNTPSKQHSENWIDILNQSGVIYEYDISSKKITIKKGSYRISKNIIFNDGLDVQLEPGTELILSKGVSIVINGNFTSVGKKEAPINITAFENQPFGVISISGNIVTIEYTKVSGGGKTDIVDGIKYSSQITINGGRLKINHSKFTNSIGDDGFNAKYAEIDIKNSIFRGNFADQIDLDYCTGLLYSNKFISNKENKDGDGVDVSGSRILIDNNLINGNGDKGISVGENSNILIANNTFNNNGKTIAVKDGSKVFLDRNTYHKIKSSIHMYSKKKFYKSPELITHVDNIKDININKKHGKLIFIDNGNLMQQYEIYKKDPIRVLN
jgi:parallel beta-helix repeat protein